MDVARRLWEVSEELTGVSFPLGCGARGLVLAPHHRGLRDGRVDRRQVSSKPTWRRIETESE